MVRALRSRGAGPAGRLAIAVALLSVLVYANSLTNGFALDDDPIIQRNHQLQSLANLSRFFGQDYFEPSRHMGLYRPLVISSYALTVAFAGGDPLPFHLVNVVLHAANAVLLLLLVLRLTGDRLLAAGAGFLFAAHAVHSEAVASITLGRPELMATLFGLLTLHLLAIASRPGAHRAGVAYAASLVCFGLALLSKESAIAILPIAVVVDWLYAQDAPQSVGRGLLATLRNGGARYAGLALVMAACVGARVEALGDMPTPPVPMVDNPLGSLPLEWRLSNAALVALRYGALLLFPLTLCSDYSFDTIPIASTLTDPALLVGLPLLCALAALGVWSARADREICFGLLFTVLAFAPASNLLLPIGTILGERLLYLPSVGFCLVLTRALQRLAWVLPTTAAGQRRALGTVLAVVCALHGARAAARNPDWRDDHTLRLHDIRIHPKSVKLQSNVGVSYLELGEPERALAHFDAAIAPGIAPGDFLNPFQGRVKALADLGRWKEARALYEQVIQYGPRDVEVEQQISEGVRAR
jgi:tetratricopeptide (TPR) repeat protein